jgi:hypothetical protein
VSKTNNLTAAGFRVAKLIDSAKHRVRESPAAALDCPGAGAAQKAVRELAEALELMLGSFAPPPGGEDNGLWEKVDS